MLVCREESSLEKDLSHAMSHDIRSPSSGSFGPFAPWRLGPSCFSLDVFPIWGVCACRALDVGGLHSVSPCLCLGSIEDVGRAK